MSEKAGSGCPGDEFLGLGKSGWKPLAVSRRKNLPGSAQLKANAFILTSWKGQKTNLGYMSKMYSSFLFRFIFGAAAFLILPGDSLGRSPTVTHDRFQGNRRVPRETLKYYVKSRAGQALDLGQVRRDARTLLELGLFDDVRVETLREPSGITLNFHLEERPFVSSVSYEGLVSFDPSRIEGILQENRSGMQEATPYDAHRAWRAARTIESSLNASGHPYAEVRVSATPTAEWQRHGCVDVVFRISEGPRVRVRHLKFEGTKGLRLSDLRKQFRDTKPAGVLARLSRKGLYTKDRLARDRVRLLGFLKCLGYAKARLGESRNEPVRYRKREVFGWPFRRRLSHGVDLTIPIYLGPRYRFGEARIEGGTLLGSDEVAELIEKLPRGEVANYEKIERVRKSIAKRYLSQGRLLAKVEVRQKLDREEGFSDVVFRVEEGPPIRLARLEFVGNRRKPDRYFRRRVKVREGDLLNMARLEKSLKRLSRLKTVEPVSSQDLELRVQEEAQEAEVVIHLRERDRLRIGLSGENTGLFGSTLKVFYDVLDLLGRRDVLGGSLEGGPQVLNLLTHWTAERFLGSPLTFGTSFFFRYWEPRALPRFSPHFRNVFFLSVLGASVSDASRTSHR